MIQINFQEAYNIVSILGFLICMYKIYKLENAIKHVTTNQLLASMATIMMTKELKEKGLIGDLDIDIQIKNDEQQS